MCINYTQYNKLTKLYLNFEKVQYTYGIIRGEDVHQDNDKADNNRLFIGEAECPV